jgi:tryptophan 7-halogenase
MNPDRRIRRIAVVGGGAAGWTTALTLNRKLGGLCSIHVVDTPEPLSPGQGEATLPSILDQLRFLGIDQNDFIEKTQSTYSLATHFEGFAAAGQSFWHGLGALGVLIERRPFYHFWHKVRAQGLNPRLELFSQEVAFAMAGRFIFPTNSLGVAQHLRYALHTDASLVTRYFRTAAERGGVIRLERKVVSATRSEDGRLDELQFEDGGKLRADLYVDCTGSRAQLIGEFLGGGYEDWSKWLPIDRVVSVPGALGDARPPCVKLTATASGWQQRMPLQQAVSHTQAYSSAHQGDEDALRELLAAAGEPLAEPRRRELRPGIRESAWHKNVIAVGAAAGGFDPLVSADQHLTCNAALNLLDHFPDAQFDPAGMASYNAIHREELERVRDFTLLHYRLSRRDDTPYWQQQANGEMSDSLRQRIDMYRASGRVMLRQPELFGDLDWFWVFEGMGVTPRDYDPLVDTIDFEQVKRVMLGISQKVAADTKAAPTHDSFFALANAKLANMRKATAPAAQSAPASPAS